MHQTVPLLARAGNLVLIAQTAGLVAADPMGGWGGLVIQSGCLGLLTILTVYVAPKLLATAKEEREKRDVLFNAVVEMLQRKHDERSTKIVEALEKQTEKFAEALDGTAERIERAVGTVCKSKG